MSKRWIIVQAAKRRIGLDFNDRRIVTAKVFLQILNLCLAKILSGVDIAQFHSLLAGFDFDPGI